MERTAPALSTWISAASTGPAPLSTVTPSTIAPSHRLVVSVIDALPVLVVARTLVSPGTRRVSSRRRSGALSGRAGTPGQERADGVVLAQRNRAHVGFGGIRPGLGQQVGTDGPVRLIACHGRGFDGVERGQPLGGTARRRERGGVPHERA